MGRSAEIAQVRRAKVQASGFLRLRIENNLRGGLSGPGTRPRVSERSATSQAGPLATDSCFTPGEEIRVEKYRHAPMTREQSSTKRKEDRTKYTPEDSANDASGVGRSGSTGRGCSVVLPAGLMVIRPSNSVGESGSTSPGSLPTGDGEWMGEGRTLESTTGGTMPKRRKAWAGGRERER